MPRPIADMSKFTELGRVIHVDFLWKMIPPRSVAWLAQQINLSPNAIFDWVYGRSRPKSDALMRLHQVMEQNGVQITLDQLNVLADQGTTQSPYRDLERNVTRDNRIPPGAREQLLNAIREVESEHLDQKN